jgi:hypothetical protein
MICDARGREAIQRLEGAALGDLHFSARSAFGGLELKPAPSAALDDIGQHGQDRDSHDYAKQNGALADAPEEVQFVLAQHRQCVAYVSLQLEGRWRR